MYLVTSGHPTGMVRPVSGNAQQRLIAPELTRLQPRPHFGSAERHSIPEELWDLITHQIPLFLRTIGNFLLRMSSVLLHPNRNVNATGSAAKPAQSSDTLKFPSPFAVRGIVEGFYGVPYTTEEREDLIRFIGRHDYNLYVYAPKDDIWGRERWWEPYPPEELAKLARTIRVAKEAGVDFSYAISPGGETLRYGSEEHFNQITQKLKVFYDLGVRSFGLFLDDISNTLRHEEDRRRYGKPANAHADLSNRLYRWLKDLDPACTLMLTPTDYFGKAPFSDYTVTLGKELDPGIEVFYTGEKVIPATITPDETGGFGEAIRRKPLMWENFPVNDAKMFRQIHIGSLRGRDPKLGQVTRGLLLNPMRQKEASKIAIVTAAYYMADPQSYDPEKALHKALEEVGGPGTSEALAEVARQTAFSNLDTEPSRMAVLVQDAVESVRRGEKITGNPSLQQLGASLQTINDACDQVRRTVKNISLRDELGGWIDNLKRMVLCGQAAIRVLGQKEKGESFRIALDAMNSFWDEMGVMGNRTTGEFLEPLIELARQYPSRSAST